jgi:hypothetical protein
MPAKIIKEKNKDVANVFPRNMINNPDHDSRKKRKEKKKTMNVTHSPSSGWELAVVGRL